MVESSFKNDGCGFEMTLGEKMYIHFHAMVKKAPLNIQYIKNLTENEEWNDYVSYANSDICTLSSR